MHSNLGPTSSSQEITLPFIFFTVLQDRRPARQPVSFIGDETKG